MTRSHACSRALFIVFLIGSLDCLCPLWLVRLIFLCDSQLETALRRFVIKNWKRKPRILIFHTSINFDPFFFSSVSRTSWWRRCGHGGYVPVPRRYRLDVQALYIYQPTRARELRHVRSSWTLSNNYALKRSLGVISKNTLRDKAFGRGWKSIFITAVNHLRNVCLFDKFSPRIGKNCPRVEFDYSGLVCVAVYVSAV